jgi:hypothetical protein
MYATAPQLGWTSRDFDDSQWPLATDLGASGIRPWGDVIGHTTARWIWTWSPDLPASAKVEEESVSLRRTFDVRCP